MGKLPKFCKYCGRSNTINFKEPMFDENTGDQKAIVWKVQCPKFDYAGRDWYGEDHTDTISIVYFEEEQEHKQKKVCTCND